MAVNKNEKTGKWYYRVYVNDPITGKRFQKYKAGFELKRDAADAEALIVSQYKERKVELSNSTFLELLDEFYSYKKRDVKETTFAGYKYQIEKHIVPFFKSFKLNKLNKDVLEVWYKSIEETEYSYKFKNKLLARLIEIFDYADHQFNFRMNYLKTFPNFKSSVKDSIVEKNIYTEEEFYKFIEHAKNLFEETFFYTLFFTGMRLGEIRAITWKDVNLNDGYIRINKQLTNKIPKMGPTIITTKSDSSNRDIQIPKLLVDKLAIWYNDRSKHEHFKTNWKVFGDMSTVSENTLRRMSKRISEESSLHYLTIHEFRHSYTTLLRNNRVDPKIIQAQLGHSTVTITLDTYTHIDTVEKQKEIRNLFDNNK